MQGAGQQDLLKISQKLNIAEKIPLDFFWVAEYKDGTYLFQFEKGKENLFKDIDQKKLKKFWLLPTREGLSIYCLHLQPWQRLIFVRRNYLTNKGTKETVYLLGWQATINNKNYKSIQFIQPDKNKIDISDNFNFI